MAVVARDRPSARSVRIARPRACRRKRPSPKDISQYRALERLLWQQSERISTRLKAKELSGLTVRLKLKSDDFEIRTRARSLETPTQLAARIFEAARALLKKEADGTRYRLLGVGVSALPAPRTPIRTIWSTIVRAARRTRNTPWTGCARSSALMRW